MFAQESVMGIKKEREAFERLPLAELAIESEFVFYNEETNSYWPNEDFCPSDAPETMNFAWEAWQAAKAHEAEKLKGCVLVPVQCPDPDFADSLFDELSKKAIGEFGDDLLIHFSDIDEEKIWALMVEAAKAQAVPEGFVLVKKELPEQIAEKMAIDRIDKPRHENDPVWREIAEQSYKDQVKSKKWEFWRDYKAMIEAQEQSHE